MKPFAHIYNTIASVFITSYFSANIIGNSIKIKNDTNITNLLLMNITNSRLIECYFLFICLCLLFWLLQTLFYWFVWYIPFYLLVCVSNLIRLLISPYWLFRSKKRSLFIGITLVDILIIFDALKKDNNRLFISNKYPIYRNVLNKISNKENRNGLFAIYSILLSTFCIFTLYFKVPLFIDFLFFFLFGYYTLELSVFKWIISQSKKINIT